VSKCTQRTRQTAHSPVTASCLRINTHPIRPTSGS